ncbi:bifunctional acetyl-CoA hydrolase/transferase family protein/GNAT family N-acetyltransferase [Desulfurivibrio alkaliphilus]|uniref:Acetyl-CoA hydrolase/transferase n=1 Tax=Desulfurivibrio alkaliphilus (strain DSM 19089 / UNIQEM U267 / AHT2) TaxID=589865 RepID=D6Z2N5_DESAT|nr:bifunctional acetyl-CoA hydrolase/transferase family protein/GNAT family N-acetyltransferase [Desulfurivibrio alkaliphilus]ADH85810.1 acetyl-CoA hydrolase/transferase [Desulfurivibrio alkaliphilus AHT 2]
MTSHLQAQPDPAWQEKYQDMIRSADQALALVRPGQRVFIGTACAAPGALVEALTRRCGELSDVEIIQLLTKGEAASATKQLQDCFHINSFFIGRTVRELIQQGLGDYTPTLLSDIPRLFSSGQLPLDVALIQVSEPDSRGKVSLGIGVDVVKSATENASLVIAQVNPRMPRTLGDSFIDIYDIDLLVPQATELIERQSSTPTASTRRIGEQIASLIEDGSTLEFGIGRIPHALAQFLKDKKDLGIHTEMLTDSMLALIEAGAVSGARKTMDRGKIVTSFCMGTRKLYDFVNNNPLFSFRPTEYVNDDYIIGRQHKMVAINMALEIDLTGQVCADSLGSRFFSGIGGQVDFNRGAARSLDGKAVIAMESTARNGEVSRIVTRLTPGAGVVTTRGEVHYVVTEHGIAYLHGKSVRERAMALISIAHPKFREQLFREALEANYLHRELADLDGRVLLTSGELATTTLLEDGTQVSFRPVHPTDEPRMKDLLYALSRETLYYRFMSASGRFTHKEIKNFVYIDHRKDAAIAGTVPEAHGEDIIAVGRYYLDEKTNRAEVAFVIRDDWQNRGLGKALFKHLVSIAKRNGIAGFTAEVLRDNRRMQAIFNHSGYTVQSRMEDDVYSYHIDFSQS